MLVRGVETHRFPESKVHWILDPGHGGIINGEYVTPGKRSPKWPDGRQLFEGVSNRDILQRMVTMCLMNRMSCSIVAPSNRDVSLRTRVKRANLIHKYESTITDGKKCIYVSVHSNAGGGTGWEIFTSPGETLSDRVATIFYEEAEKELPEFKFRRDMSDGDPDKESKFYVLVNTSMPAVLTENLFMDTLNPDCEFLFSENGKQRIAELHFNAMKRIEQNGVR
jgi:N-acetylmuramoyl-L-alanine amidase